MDYFLKISLNSRGLELFLWNFLGHFRRTVLLDLPDGTIFVSKQVFESSDVSVSFMKIMSRKGKLNIFESEEKNSSFNQIFAISTFWDRPYKTEQISKLWL